MSTKTKLIKAIDDLVENAPLDFMGTGGIESEQIEEKAWHKRVKKLRGAAKKPDQVLKIVQAFVKKQEISCPETVYQSDRVIENAYEFMEELFNAAGYHKDKDSA